MKKGILQNIVNSIIFNFFSKARRIVWVAVEAGVRTGKNIIRERVHQVLVVKAIRVPGHLVGAVSAGFFFYFEIKLITIVHLSKNIAKIKAKEKVHHQRAHPMKRVKRKDIRRRSIRGNIPEILRAAQKNNFFFKENE